MLNSGFVALFVSFPLSPNWAEALSTRRAGLRAQLPCLGWMCLSEPRVQPQQRLSPLCHSAAGRCEQTPRGEPVHASLLLQGLMLQHIGEATQCHPLSPAGQPLLREGLAHLQQQQQQQHRLPEALLHPCTQNPANTSPNPPLCSLKQAFISAAAGEV